MPKSSKSTQLVYEGGELDGTPVYSTSNISDKKFIYGDFSNLVIGNWGGIDLTVDPYTKAAAGQVRLVINAFFDAKVIRPEAFVTGAVA
jgi:HK97 family phage major capsid protein